MVDNGKFSPISASRSGSITEIPEDEYYDPYLKKQPKTPSITSTQAFFLLIQAVVGTGILQAVFVFRQGWITGIILTALIGIICTHCLHILFQAKYRLCKTLKIPHLKYAQSVERAFEMGPPSIRQFSRLSHYVVDVCFILCQLGLCCIFASMALSLTPVVDGLIRSFLAFKVDISTLFSVSLLPLILARFMKDLNVVANLCVLGVVFLLASSAVILVFLLQDPRPFGSFEMFEIDVKTLPIYIGTLVFSMQAVTVVTHIDDNLESPKAFSRPCGIITIGMFLIIVVQCILGFLVYWRFDNDGLTISTIPIFFVTNDILVVCTAFYMVDTYISYGLHEFIYVNIIWNKLENRCWCTRFLWCSLPIILSGVYMAARTYTESLLPECIITIILGTTVPILGIIFPALMDISLNWPNNFRRAKLIHFKNIFLVIFGLSAIFCSLVYCFLPSNF
ncbi:proton-coupled amino acid transporter-like protein CG1139 [Coccinella septempunctata]|uniref:proton-coupled amino acid transporter-like protein CG1139 n=1 Tax=Coccinella septempunctata TaxID=41139 RepID=UPI001D05C660|nr:proton-coupled amino acid transporter-like protein CG1139 [Coccinella septempunctata]